MQAAKEKLHDMNAMRKVKAEARAEEKAEKESAKARREIAHEVRLAKVAEAEMDLHVAKAGEKADREIARRASRDRDQMNNYNNNNNNNNNNNPTDTTAAPGDPIDDAFSDPTVADAAAAGPTYPASGAAPRNNLL